MRLFLCLRILAKAPYRGKQVVFLIFQKRTAKKLSDTLLLSFLRGSQVGLSLSFPSFYLAYKTKIIILLKRKVGRKNGILEYFPLNFIYGEKAGDGIPLSDFSAPKKKCS